MLDKRLITTAGRKEVIGRPILYKTSKEFLMRFGLSDLDELPSLKEFEALAREALGSDEGVAPTETSDESVLDAPRESAAPATAELSEQLTETVPEEVAADSQPSEEARAEEPTPESDEQTDDQAHKTAAAGE